MRTIISNGPSGGRPLEQAAGSLFSNSIVIFPYLGDRLAYWFCACARAFLRYLLLRKKNTSGRDNPSAKKHRAEIIAVRAHYIIQETLDDLKIQGTELKTRFEELLDLASVRIIEGENRNNSNVRELNIFIKIRHNRYSLI